jgi:hypothetical protein
MVTTTQHLADIQAEEALIGACLLSDTAIETSSRILEPNDFRTPQHQTLYARILDQYRTHGRVDIITLTKDLPTETTTYVRTLFNNTPSVSGAAQYATTIAGWKLKRDIIERAARLTELAQTTADPDEIADTARALFQGIDMPTTRGAPDPDIDTFIANTSTDYDWLIPDFLERRDRMLVTAGEGAGKSVLNTQIAIMTSAGIHPWTRQRTTPRNVTLIDLENGQRLVSRRAAWLRRCIETPYDPQRLRIHTQPRGIDLTTRTDRRWLIDRCEANNTELLVIGPAYRMYAGNTERGDIGGENQMRTITAVLDDIRDRTGVALLLETHAPHGNGLGRDLRPFGSSVWLRWPEFGVGLRRDSDRPNRYFFEHWRGPRDKRTWPTELLRDEGRWPWTPIMPTGSITTGRTA